MVLFVEQPIRDRETAELARGHFVYCPSVPEQNIVRFARPVYNSHWWSFWWD